MPEIKQLKSSVNFPESNNTSGECTDTIHKDDSNKATDTTKTSLDESTETGSGYEKLFSNRYTDAEPNYAQLKITDPICISPWQQRYKRRFEPRDNGWKKRDNFCNNSAFGSNLLQSKNTRDTDNEEQVSSKRSK